MKILFVQPEAGFMMRGTTYPICRSLMVTATYMKSLGHEVLIYDKCIDFRKPEKVINSFKPEMVMIYVPPTASLEGAIEISKISKQLGAVIVWAEVVACALSEQLVEKGLADFVITGETEAKLESLISELNGDGKFGNIPGLTFIDGTTTISTENKNNSDLENIPAIDWDLIDVKKCFREFPHCKRMLYLYTSRGCPNKCAFCYNTMFYNSEYRKRPLKYFLEEVKHLEENYRLDGVNFSDEVLLLNEEEINGIADFRRKNNLKFFWGGQTRADAYTSEETLKKMYDAGCRWLLLGLETGSAETRKQINKPMNQDMIKEFVDKCTRAKITTFGSFIVGFPDETEEQLKETVKFAQSLNLDGFLFNFYIVVPKTPLCNKLVEKGVVNISEMFDKANPAQQLQNLSRNYSKVSDRDLLVIKSWFDWMTFTRKKAESTQKNAFIEKALDTLKHFAEGNLKNSINNIFNAGKTFLTILIYSHCFPKIKKKYGLKNINKKH